MSYKSKPLPLTFVCAATESKLFPDDSGNEIALCGRSNSGKSTLINTLANQKKLAKTSNTPGRTQSINFFHLVNDEAKKIIDLPGFGYAKASKQDQNAWAKLILSYLEKMSTIKYYAKTNIGSRPSKRPSDSEGFDFENLRAIPFVGGWSQLKQNVPGFYGLGSALNYFEKNNNFDKINQLFIDVPFFRALISNSMMSLKKSFFELTLYLKDDKEFSEFWNLIHDEYELTKKMLLKVSGFKKLMQDEPANMASIETREKIILPLFTIQQYAIQSINKLSKSSIEDLKKVKVYEKIITRSLFGNINASRNSA